jgi:hypothetical protein
MTELRKSLVLDLENAVLALENHYTIEEIFAFVNCINRGFITDGTWSEDYLRWASQALYAKEEKSRIITDLSGLK